MAGLAIDLQLARVQPVRKRDRLIGRLTLLISRQSIRTIAREQHRFAQQQTNQQQ